MVTSNLHARVAARRRRGFAAVIGLLSVMVLVAVVTGSSVAWWAFVAFLPVVCAYLAVLSRARRLMAEREINIAFLGGAERDEAGFDQLLRAPRGEGWDQRGAVGAGQY
ncbi:MAG: hypothetical protein ACRDZX_02955 [Acidimicrobiales bacterium]